MRNDPARRIKLTDEERLNLRIPIHQAAEIKGISTATFRKYFKHLIEQVTPGCQVVRFGDVIE
jgi:hypothetical protein